MVTVLNPIEDTTTAVTVLPIALDNGEPIAYTAIYSIYVPGLQPSDVVLVNSQIELVGSYPYYVGLGRYILRASGPTNTTSGTYVSKPVMTNLMPGQSMATVTMMGMDSGMPAGDYYYNVVMYCVGSSLLGTGQTIEVSSNTGNAEVLVLTA